MPGFIPAATVTREVQTVRFAQLLHDLSWMGDTKPVEIATETHGPAVLQAYQLGADMVYTRTTFDLSEPVQELWYQHGGEVIQVQDSDLIMFGEAIEQTWRHMYSKTTLTLFVSVLTQLKLKLALLAARTEHMKLQSALSLLR